VLREERTEDAGRRRRRRDALTDGGCSRQSRTAAYRHRRVEPDGQIDFQLPFDQMVDKLSRERRSWNMSRIRGRNTVPEREVRSILHSMGCRFRLHAENLPGRPDVVLAKHRTVVVVHGCFWHRHTKCRYAYTPKSNLTFWSTKFNGNVERDRRTTIALRGLGWRVVTVWECELRKPAKLRSRLARLLGVGA
jgi:DNA mismatch endonuclease, patch repair protein